MSRTISVPGASCLLLVVSLTACGGKDDAESTAAASGSSGSESASTFDVTSGDSMGSTSLDTTGVGETNDPPMGECVPWESDKCGESRKCMPYSVEDDRLPDFFQCCDEISNPALPGEPCEIMEYDGSCLDTCIEGSMCVLDNPDQLAGQCRAFCDPSRPECDNDQTCKSFFELLPAVVTTPLCMDKCDPLQQDCSQAGWQCIPDTPTESGQSGFLCSPPPPKPPKTALEECALANDCEAGLVCVPRDRIPDCGFLSCCTAYCSLSEGDAPCEALHPDLQCVDWMSPDPTWSDVGACVLPT